ncbi:hypothetical protein Gotur_002137 [Gossypium turneri]
MTFGSSFGSIKAPRGLDILFGLFSNVFSLIRIVQEEGSGQMVLVLFVVMTMRTFCMPFGITHLLRIHGAGLFQQLNIIPFFLGDLHDWFIGNLQNYLSLQLEGIDCWAKQYTFGLKANESNCQTPLSTPPKFSNWIQLSTCSALDVELWGIFEGVTIVMDKGFDRILIISDSQEAVQAIQGSVTKTSNSALAANDGIPKGKRCSIPAKRWSLS